MLAEAMHPMNESVTAKALPAAGKVGGGAMQATETILAQAAQYAVRTTCSDRCPYGNICCLDGEAPHALHICSYFDCRCHSEWRYRVAHRKYMLDRET